MTQSTERRDSAIAYKCLYYLAHSWLGHSTLLLALCSGRYVLTFAAALNGT